MSLPMRGNGRSISSADCGMTSKPTKRKGTTTSTAAKPANPPVTSGSACSSDPPTPTPTSMRIAMMTRKRTMKVCTTDAGRMPTTLIAVSRTAAAVPMTPQPR